MVRPCGPNQILQEPNLATGVTDLQQQLLEQQRDMNSLWDQTAHLNQMPHANEVPPQENLVPPEVPQIPEVN